VPAAGPPPTRNLQARLAEADFDSVNVTGIEGERGPDGRQNLGIVERVVRVDQPVAKARRGRQQSGELRGQDTQVA
jgi:hypothetical protein